VIVAMSLGAGAAAGPVVYQADLVLQVRPPADAELGDTALDAATTEAAIELSETRVLARVRRDLGRSAANRLPPVQIVDGLLAVWPVRGGKLLPLGVEVRTVAGTGRLHLYRRSFNPVRAALVLNTLADEFVRGRLDGVGQQEARLGAALAQVEDRLRANAADYEQEMSRHGAGDRDLLVAAAVPACSQGLATRYGAVTHRPAGAPTDPKPPPPEGLRDRGPSYGEQVRQALAGLRLRRDDLAARYTPGSPPLREVEAAIAGLEAAQRGTDAAPAAGSVLPRHPAGPSPEARRVATADRGLATLGHRGLAAQKLTWRADQLVRQRDLLRRNAEDLASALEQVRLRRLTGTSGGADVEVIETARVPGDGRELRGGLLFGALVCALAAFLFRPRSGPVSDRR
jgi:uncharacterized protein involved in exopolysaccharide biosynthesis